MAMLNNQMVPINGINDFFMIYQWHITMENHHAINGKTHELSVAIFNSELFVYQG